MSTTARKQNKRTAVYLELKTARQHLKNAGEELADCSKILDDMLKGLHHVSTAVNLAQRTHISGGKPKQDALPKPMRNKIIDLHNRISNLMGQIQAIPVTQDEKATAQLKKVKKKGEIT